MAERKRGRGDETKGEAEAGLVREFVAFVRQNKKLWLIPLVLLALLVILGLLMSQSGALAPFMYSPQ